MLGRHAMGANFRRQSQPKGPVGQSGLRQGRAESRSGALEVKGWPKSTSLHSITVVSNTLGYYKSELTTHAKPEDREFDIRLMIREIGNPIPMYAKKVELALPEQRKEIGFDFEQADWIKPYGEGRVADVTFLGTKNFEDDRNYETTVVLSCSHKNGGIQPDAAQKNGAFQLSKFKTARKAPDEGYQDAHKFIWVRSGNSRKGSTKEANYIFRSRVVLDQSGQIKSCHYGKLIGAVNVARKSGCPDTNPVVSFTYYFNPTPNDRNLEFEPKENLFGALEWDEEVREP